MDGSTMLLFYPIMVYSVMVIDTVSSVCSPGSYYQWSQQQCSPCKPGTYKQNFGYNDCQYCNSGTYSSSPGSISCSACEAGKYQPHTGQTSCHSCEIGQYQPSVGQGWCYSCGYDETTIDVGSTSESECVCAPGHYYKWYQCHQCVPGTYKTSPGDTNCNQCNNGTYSSSYGAISCTECEAGKTTIGSGSTSKEQCVCPPGHFYKWWPLACFQCEPGTYKTYAGNTSPCVNCFPGTYSNSSGATSCTKCEIGKYQDLEGQTSCNSCEYGKITLESGSTSSSQCVFDCESGKFYAAGSDICQDCPTGTYQPSRNQSSCLSCKPGSFQNRLGQNDCVSCQAGSYSNTEGATICIPCKPGTYQYSPNKSSCVPCPIGQYQPSEAQPSCYTCEPSTNTTGVGSNSQNDCLTVNTAKTGADSKEHNTSLGVIAGGAGGAIALLVVVAIVIFIAIRRHRLKETSSHKTSRQDNVLPPRNESQLKTSIQQQIREVVYTNLLHEEDSKEECKIDASNEYTSLDNTYYNMEENALLPRGAVMLSNLWDYVQEKTLDGSKLSEEFEALPSGLLSSAKAALKPSNCQKNRYNGLYPYDSTRVRLLPLGEDKSDYINASFIDGYSRPKAYIASQGTTKFNLNDFWRMVYQQDVEKIVMLTRLVEGDTIKCLQYWPKEGSQQQYGGIKVTLVHVDTFAEYDIRTLTMTVENTTKQVTQFHFTAWPDKGVPEAASSIVQFWHKVRNMQSHKRSPTLVHCSAGIGRTGTYIALDYLADQGKDKKYVHIFPCVAQLRRQRVNFVQTEAQYGFLHEALVEALMISGSAVTAETFPSVYKELLAIDRKQRKTGLLLEFEKLQNESNKAVYHSAGDYDTDDEEDESESKKEKITNNSQSTSRLEINKHKNRYSNILPADECRPCLSKVEGRNDYINAVKLPSHRQKDGLIVTQMPMEDTVIDFWRLVYDFGVRTIVMLNVLPINKEGIGVYWPCKGESMTEMVFNIENIDENTDNTNYLWRTIRLTKDGEQPRQVRQFQCNFWPGSEKVPKQMNAILELIDAVEQWQRRADVKTVVIHCMDGAERSGLYCVLTTVLERLNVERDVAIYQTVKKMRTRRQQIIPNFEQYKYCHDVVLEYLSNFGMYSNFTDI